MFVQRREMERIEREAEIKRREEARRIRHEERERQLEQERQERLAKREAQKKYFFFLVLGENVVPYPGTLNYALYDFAF